MGRPSSSVTAQQRLAELLRQGLASVRDKRAEVLVPYYSPAELRELVLQAPLRTLEMRVSAPVVNRHIAALERGQSLPRLKVGDGTIIEGLHWYVAAYIVGRSLSIEQTPPPDPNAVRYSMRQVIFEGLDWENMTGRRN